MSLVDRALIHALSIVYRLKSEEEGQGVVEYTLVLGAAIAAVVVALTSLKSGIRHELHAITAQL